MKIPFKKKIKQRSVLEIDTEICLKKTKKMKNMENNTEKIYLKNT